MGSSTGSLDVEYLIGEVASRHGILLRPDDPTFALITINRLVFEQVVTDLLAKVERAVQHAGGLETEDIHLAALVEKVLEKAERDRQRVSVLSRDPKEVDDLVRATAVCTRQIHEAGERALHMADAFGKRFRWTLWSIASVCFLVGVGTGSLLLWWVIQR